MVIAVDVPAWYGGLRVAGCGLLAAHAIGRSPYLALPIVDETTELELAVKPHGGAFFSSNYSVQGTEN